MRRTKNPPILAAALLLAVLAGAAEATELVSLSPQTWDRYAPSGKEADAIYGDFVLANDQILAVVAIPRRGRNANMTVREVGGCLIDLTRRDRQSDQLSAYYPGAQLREWKFGGIEVEAPEVVRGGRPGAGLRPGAADHAPARRRAAGGDAGHRP